MHFRDGEWEFIELTSVPDKLVFTIPGKGEIEIIFNIKNLPSQIREYLPQQISYYFSSFSDHFPDPFSIPEEIKSKLFEAIHINYPNGFHSRDDDEYFEMLKKELHYLAVVKNQPDRFMIFWTYINPEWFYYDFIEYYCFSLVPNISDCGSDLELDVDVLDSFRL